MSVYHYHATTLLRDGAVAHMDGILTTDGPIRTFADYNNVKEMLHARNAAALGLVPDQYITIRSLTKLES